MSCCRFFSCGFTLEVQRTAGRVRQDVTASKPPDRQVKVALMNYAHLTQDERYQIAVPCSTCHAQADITRLLDRHRATISRELSRNSGLRGYRPKQAEALC